MVLDLLAEKELELINPNQFVASGDDDIDEDSEDEDFEGDDMDEEDDDLLGDEGEDSDEDEI